MYSARQKRLWICLLAGLFVALTMVSGLQCRDTCESKAVQNGVVLCPFSSGFSTGIPILGFLFFYAVLLFFLSRPFLDPLAQGVYRRPFRPPRPILPLC
jgi:hypothetical protein